MSFSTATPIDYRNKHFVHESLTPVTGPPTYESIRLSQLETLQNLNSVSTPCKHPLGHIALGVSPEKFQRLSTVPYTRPAQPDPIEPVQAGNDPPTEEARKQYETALHNYNETNRLESICCNLLLKAYEPAYVRPLCDRITGLLTCSIPKFFEYMFDAYGNITPVSIAHARQNVLNHQYNHDHPMESVFDAINEFSDLSEARGTIEPDTHLIDMALIILMNANIFSDAIEEWNDLPTSYHTWTNCQKHFCDAQKKYKKARSTATSASLGFSTANLVTNHPSPAETQAIQDAADAYLAQLATPEPPTHEANQVICPPVSTNSTALESLLQKFKDLESKLESTKLTPAKPNHKEGKKKPRTLLQLYCWTHGCCAHKGADCRNKATGHKDEATFQNMMGGSTKNCFWIPSPSA